jgi:hypothetical protein
MTEYEALAKAISIATQAHEGQYDKAGKPYILHSLHIMNELLFDTQLATIAVLHDVVEDSHYSFDELVIDGFSDRVLAALILLTHDDQCDYLDDYIPSVCTNYDAIKVKIKDIEHNCDITRLEVIEDSDLARLKKYHTAYGMLNEAKNVFL